MIITTNIKSTPLPAEIEQCSWATTYSYLDKDDNYLAYYKKDNDGNWKDCLAAKLAMIEVMKASKALEELKRKGLCSQDAVL